MNSFSHLLVGRFLNQYIHKHYGVKLRVPSFLYWNIMADFRKPYKMPPHYLDYWARHLQSETEALAAQTHTNARFGTDFSKRLGVLCHFYADFFCFVHTPSYQGTYWQHIKYEWLLYRFTRKNFLALTQSNDPGDVGECLAAGDIFGQFEALQRSYLAEAPSYENDMVYTLRACLGAVTLLTTRAPEAAAPEAHQESRRITDAAAGCV